MSQSSGDSAPAGVWREKQEGGTDEADLERIFARFIRLDGLRPGLAHCAQGQRVPLHLPAR
ncbi:hypothetical protein CUU62_22795 [Pseudomonas sp. WP001]|nr:hypothetical protein CUU62_22795 [Pseudomonas sp. WP001]